MLSLKVSDSVSQDYFSEMHMPAGENEENWLDYKVRNSLVSVFMNRISEPVVVSYCLLSSPEETFEDQSEPAA